MRQFFRFLTCLGLLLIPMTLTSAGTRELSAPKRVSMVPGELIVAFKPGYSAANLSMNGQSLMTTTRSLGSSRRGTQFARLKLQQDVSLEQALATYSADPAVLAVSPNYLRYPTLTRASRSRAWRLSTARSTEGAIPSSTSRRVHTICIRRL